MSAAGKLAETRLARAMRASGAVFAAALLVSLGAMSAPLSIGIAAGYAIGLGILASWAWIVRRALTPEAARDAAGRARALAVFAGFLKLPIVVIVVFALLSRGLITAPGFAIGFAVPQVTIALFALGARAARSNVVVEEGAGA